MQRSQAGGRDGWLLQKRLNVADDHMLYLQEVKYYEREENIQKENMV